jgi:hypothetical protein
MPTQKSAGDYSFAADSPGNCALRTSQRDLRIAANWAGGSALPKQSMGDRYIRGRKTK